MSDLPKATLSLIGPGESLQRGAHLLIIEGSSSWMAPLPLEGVLVIGRAHESNIRLHDDACSRKHAHLHVADGEVRLEDLGSHNGTRVNGERVEGSRLLAEDDVISIGPVKLVLLAAQVAPRSLLNAAQLRERVAQEVERTVSHERPLSVTAIAIDRAGREDAVRKLRAILRPLDVIGALDERHLVVVSPELHPEAAHDYAQQIAELVSARVGIAHCPIDGHRGDVLLAAARGASTLPGGDIHEAHECVTSIELGGTTALVAEPSLIQVYELVRRLAASELNVLISGETGVGKEHVALAVHHWSRRTGRPFVAINCASLPETLIESELFGHEKGAFSGAVATKPGRLEAAAGGSVFLDEVGELPPSAQAKLLRALEARRATRLGGIKEYPLDLRIVAATHRDLPAEIKAGRFREDLYFRLSGATVALPPLRDRPRELLLLARHFLENAHRGGSAPSLSIAALAALARYPWPGNVRELKNEMEFVAATITEPVVEPWHLSEKIVAAPEPPPGAATTRLQLATFRPIADEVRDLERRRMKEALLASGGVQRRAAELIGMPARTFTMKYKQYGLGEK